MLTIHSDDSSEHLFMYTPTPSIYKVSPKRGPVEGGTLVRIVGLHFDMTAAATSDVNNNAATLSSCQFKFNTKHLLIIVK